MKRLIESLAGVAVVAVCSAAFLCPSNAAAYSFVYHFDIGGDPIFSGTPPGGPAPWVDVAFQDVAPGTVQFSVSSLLTGTEKLTELYINLNPALNPTSLNFTQIGSSGGFTLPTINQGLNAYKADGDGKYDVRLNFSQTPSDSFTSGEYLVYDITGISGLTATDFIFLSQPAGGHGPFLAAAHIQGINATSVDDGTTASGWLAPSEATPLTIPEPGSLSLVFLIGGAWFARRFCRS